MKARKAQKTWSRTASEIAVILSGLGSVAEAALRERLLRPAHGLDSLKAKGERHRVLQPQAMNLAMR